MRNAAAHFDDDFGYDEPARKKAPRQPRAKAPKPRARKKKGKRGFNVDMHKVARYAAIGMSATVALGIMVNALMMQKGHHPAPLFAKKIEIGPSEAPAPAARVAPAPQQDAAHTPAAEQPSTDVVPTPPAKPRRVTAPAPADTAASEKASADDPIARLLTKGSVGGAGAPADKTDPKTMMGVQRALVKLGYVLKPNGTMGPLTKKAIEGFEKDRHMPVNGEVNHRLVKVLAAESGIKID